MNNYKFRLADIIPDLSAQMGIDSLSDLPRAVVEARQQGYPDLANWFEVVIERLERAVREEWEISETSSDYAS